MAAYAGRVCVCLFVCCKNTKTNFDVHITFSIQYKTDAY